MNAKELFNKEILIGAQWNNEKYVESVIEFIKNEWDIDTTRKELLIEIVKKANTYKGTNVLDYYLTIKPTQELLRKFEKDYPEMII